MENTFTNYQLFDKELGRSVADNYKFVAELDPLAADIYEYAIIYSWQARQDVFWFAISFDKI